ncbi:MAG: HAMP domain-containing histidine kinase [Bdellovibrionales bacterium]|nr:HAMP domain-containing histidine kinase [Bdellovibrionales bacterium]
MQQPKTTAIKRILIIPGLIVTSLSSIILLIVITLSLYQGYRHEMLTRFETIAEHFKENVSESVLLGEYNSTYTFCKRLSLSHDVKSILVEGTDGTKVCSINQHESSLHPINSFVFFDDQEKEKAAVIRLGFDLSSLRQELIRSILFGLFVAGAFLGFHFLTYRYLAKKIGIPIRAQSQLLESGSLEEMRDCPVDLGGNVSELHLLLSGIKTMSSRLIESQIELKFTERLRTINEVSRKVAHDIRSPLSALNALASSAKDREEKNTLTTISDRLNDIVSDLLNSNNINGNLKSNDAKKIYQPNSLPVESIVGILKKLEIEIRATLEQGIKFKIETYFGNKAIFHFFTKIDLSKLVRVLSNIINNSIDAISSNGGQIKVTAHFSNDSLKFTVIDNGKGIKEEILLRLGKEELTFDKTDGNGLGVYGAYQQVNSWNGKISYRSQINIGTEVTVEIPCK